MGSPGVPLELEQRPVKLVAWSQLGGKTRDVKNWTTMFFSPSHSSPSPSVAFVSCVNQEAWMALMEEPALYSHRESKKNSSFLTNSSLLFYNCFMHA